MDYQIFPFLSLGLSITIAVFIIYSKYNSDKPGATGLFYLLITILGWLLTNTAEMMSPNRQISFFWGRFNFPFMITTPVLWFIFLLDYLGYDSWRKLPRLVIIWIIPIISLVAFFLNDQYHFFLKSSSIEHVGNYHILKPEGSWFFYISSGYNNLLTFIGIIILIRELFYANRLNRPRFFWMIFGLSSISLLNILSTFHLLPFLRKDYTPIAMAICGVIFFLIVFKYHLYKISNLGVAVLSELLEEGIIDVDADYKIVNINSAAQTILSTSNKDCIGKDAREIFPFLPRFDSKNNNSIIKKEEVCVKQKPACYIKVKINPIIDHHGKTRSHLVVFHDITEEKICQLAEHDERLFAQGLSQIAEALNSTRHLDELLDLIINIIINLNECDSANIMMIEEKDARVVRSLKPSAQLSSFSIEDTYTLKWMIENKLPILIPDVDDYPGWKKTPQSDWIRSYIGAPIITKSQVIGFISVDSATPNSYKQKDADHLQAFANQASVAIWNAQVNQKMEELTITDSLTQLFNRRHFFELVTKEFIRASRYQRILSVIMLDIDLFKKVNDTYGHAVGDHVLQHIARVCKLEMRSTDIIARYGGEEFVIALPETDLFNAEIMAKRLCNAIELLSIPSPKGNIRVTVSLGVAQMDETCQRLEDLFEHADIALYQAKVNGRNRVEIYIPQVR